MKDVRFVLSKQLSKLFSSFLFFLSLLVSCLQKKKGHDKKKRKKEPMTSKECIHKILKF